MDNEKHVRSNVQRNQSRVVAAFPATGKTHYAERHAEVADSDSSGWSWTPGTRERDPHWPGNYMAHIKSLLTEGVTVFVGTHAEVRAALVAEGIPFTLVIPGAELQDEYRARMEQRGSPEALIAKVIDELWDDALADCMDQCGCDLVILEAGEYLSDVIA